MYQINTFVHFFRSFTYFCHFLTKCEQIVCAKYCTTIQLRVNYNCDTRTRLQENAFRRALASDFSFLNRDIP